MKKLIMMVTAVTLLALILTACGSSKKPEETTGSTDAATESNAAGTEAATEAAEKLEDGTFKVDVTMEGGTGKATIKSPATVVVKDGEATAVIIWSSDKYDYMMVDGKKYEPITTEGGSTFKIPVLAFDEPFTVIGDTTAMSTPHEIEYTFTFDSAGLKEPVANLDAEFAADKEAAEKAAETQAETKAEKADEKADEKTDAKADEKAAAASNALEDGSYIAEFNTDSSMFHVNEAKDGKGELTVKDGEMTIHISLVSKKIVNLFPGTAEDAQKDGAVLLDPTTDSVTYSDGMTEDVYGFDVPVPVLDEEFDLAILGESGKWFDHKVSVTDPQPAE